MPECLVTHLRHVDFAVPDYGRQLTFFRDTWGLTPTTDGAGLSYFAAEGSPEPFVVRLRAAEEKRLDLLAFGAASSADVDAVAAQVAVATGRLVSEPGPLATPGAGYGFRFFDIDGRTVEISSDVRPRAHRKVEPREAIPVRISHVVVNSTDAARTRSFYEEVLGFRLSDTLRSPHMGDLMYFLRCSPQHHSFAVARGPHVALHHASFELRDVDDYLRGTGRVKRAGTKLVWGPGRHTAGDNTFSYFLDPSGNTVEYTTELSVLDEDTWHPSIYDTEDQLTQDQWGTAAPMSEEIAKESFNDMDKGLFVAPPV